jgi:hypothetical protein
MEHIAKGRGRPSKGPRHSFTVKLDMRRAVKLKEILEILNTTGIEYLVPIIEAHLDAIDLDELRNQPRAEPMAAAENSSTRSAVQRTLTQEESLRRAQTLARKINLLLDARTDESGQPYDYPAIEAGAEKAGFSLSRTRWSLLKNGKDQVVPDACLRAIAKVFDVDPEYLLHDDAELPTDVEAMLPQVRIKRLFRLRDLVVKELGGPVDPEGLKAITKMLDQAIQQ